MKAKLTRSPEPTPPQDIIPDPMQGEMMAETLLSVDKVAMLQRRGALLLQAVAPLASADVSFDLYLRHRDFQDTH